MARVDVTRRDLVEAATRVFAAHGYERGSVREIAAAAQANVAAISYHFGGKAGLYREVLRRAIDAFYSPALDPPVLAAASPEQAARVFIRAQFDAFSAGGAARDYARIFAWENVQRSEVLRDLAETETLPLVEAARAVLDRFLPDADPEIAVVALVWLLNQVGPFMRERDRLSRPPLNLRLDDAALTETLCETLTALVVGGLRNLSAIKSSG